MKIPALVSLALFILGVAAFLLQLWFRVWEEETFAKLIISDGLLLAVSLVILYALRETAESKRIDRELD